MRSGTNISSAAISIAVSILHLARQAHPYGGRPTGAKQAHPSQQPCSWSGHCNCQILGALWIREVGIKDIH